MQKKRRSSSEANLPKEANLGHSDYYSQLSNQQFMLEDSVRTGAYHSALIHNLSDFVDKVVLDVGAGTGVLSFFAAQAGARRVYAVEPTEVAAHARRLVEANGMSGRIDVIQARVQDLELPEKVDVIVSEPMGILLVHERILEMYLSAASRWLKPGGKMFPCRGRILLSPFSDAHLYTTTRSKARFWEQKNFFGIDLSSLVDVALRNHFSRPFVGPVDANILMAAPAVHEVDFTTATIDELRQFKIVFDFRAKSTGIVHGLAGWFDVTFDGSLSKEYLTTSPDSPGTHWNQIRFLFQQPVALNVGQRFSGEMSLKANDRQSYDVVISGSVKGTDAVIKQDFFINGYLDWWHSPGSGSTSSSFPEHYGLYSSSG